MNVDHYYTQHYLFQYFFQNKNQLVSFWLSMITIMSMMSRQQGRSKQGRGHYIPPRGYNSGSNGERDYRK
jgi:hypothetical protein